MSKERERSDKISAKFKRNVNHRALFKPRTKREDDDELSYRLVISARKTGKLNLASRGLATVPNKIWTINDLTNEEIEELRLNLDFEDERDPWWEQEPLKALNLSSNSITNVDPKIEYLGELTDLDFSHNLLEELPQEIGTLRKLERLDLSRNKLGRIDDSFYKLSELRQLNLSSNKLVELSPSIGDLVMLESLNLSCNELIELPVGMGYLVRLVNLDISHNQLRELPPDIMSMRVLKKLDASFNKLEVVPALGELRKVELIVMHNNQLSTFPDLTGCTALRDLDLANNNITEIKMEYLEDMGQLRSLRIDSNKVKEIPEEIVKLLNLEHLDLSCNELSNIPNFISIMPNLKYFGIEGNDVKNIRRDIIQCGAPRILRHLRQSFEPTKIDLNESSSLLTSVVNTPDKYVMRNTKLLSLTGQGLSEVPNSVLEDASEALVTCVDLSRNKLREVPEKLSSIETVTDLKLTSNNLCVVDEWLGERLIHLSYLDLSQNLLTDLPTSLSNLRHLREINISFNRFTKIPDCIYEITRLEILIGNDNQITEIDEVSLRNLQRLATLDLSNNNIVHVPPELGNHTHLRTLLLTGNCFKQPRHATLTKGTEEILSYLRDRIPT
ncbi:leucine-rich repeat-containing protein 40-like isoform X1 [Venturia canescens]|uniref:leucine-rich repeat-containing protein 40-like isoform X1 n=1 Tax=Venturia canescens TaxID=32260 RepID=UPI001C9D47D3|nr:leucine-rich repeat-containing protein 40-like isoform X1 [Venturia canescens]